MTVAAGSVVCLCGSHLCSGTGLQWIEEDLGAALERDTTAVLSDDKSTAKIVSLLANIPDDDFAPDRLSLILDSQPESLDCRVGEAIAESWDWQKSGYGESVDP